MVEKQIDQEKLEEAIMKELRLDGLVNADEAVIQKLDQDFTAGSSVIPVSRTKNGLSKTSKTVNDEEFREIRSHHAIVSDLNLCSIVF